MNDASTIDQASMLLTLEESSHLVSHSHDPRETLANIVRLIQNRFQTAVCSIYLLELQQRELVLAATVGLRPEGIGRVRMNIDEGLTGLVAEQLQPVMVEDAFSHARFKYFPEAGEDPYRSFLGIPLLDCGELVGVLVVQTSETRVFSTGEIRMLSIIGAQVAPLVDDARLLERVIATVHEEAAEPSAEPDEVSETLTGTSLSAGRGLGRAYVVDGLDEWRDTVAMEGRGLELEEQRLEHAMEQARDELVQLSTHLSELVGEEHGAILQAQLMIMQDRAIQQDLHACLEAGASAEGALFQTLDKYVAAFQRMTSPYLKERVYDIKDVLHRLLWQLRSRPTAASSTEDRIVLVAHEPSVMELFSIDPGRLAGMVVEHGSPESHVAILARSLGIPMVGQIPRFHEICKPDQLLLIDGSKGVVYRNPTDEAWRQACGVWNDPESGINAALPTVSEEVAEGMPRVEVNVNLLWEVEPAVRQGAGGIGLFRSEFLFLARRTLPTEEEQVDVYRKLIAKMEGRPVTIRTFDLRPDKVMTYSQLSSTAAKPLDWRLVMSSPPLQKLFREQVRAVLRAGAADSPGRIGPIRLMIPLVTHTELLDFVLDTLRTAKEDLASEGLAFADDVALGVMIETAAATAMLDLWAPHVDFFALGTNDLTASALGLDRDDALTLLQSRALHPGVLRLIDRVVRSAKELSRPVSVCGELAADREGCLALAALGVNSLSVPVQQFVPVRLLLEGVEPEALRELAPRILQQRNADQVRDLIRESCKVSAGQRKKSKKRKTGVINFYSLKDEHGAFSNFAPYPIELKGCTWPTSEHYFQAQKFADSEREDEIRRVPSPMAAARMGRSRKQPMRGDWESAKVQIMHEAVLAKFVQHPELREMLLATGDATLVEHTENDSFWGDGGDGSGRNMLGKILMRVRDELRE